MTDKDKVRDALIEFTQACADQFESIDPPPLPPMVLKCDGKMYDAAIRTAALAEGRRAGLLEGADAVIKLIPITQTGGIGFSHEGRMAYMNAADKLRTLAHLPIPNTAALDEGRRAGLEEAAQAIHKTTPEWTSGKSLDFQGGFKYARKVYMSAIQKLVDGTFAAAEPVVGEPVGDAGGGVGENDAKS